MEKEEINILIGKLEKEHAIIESMCKKHENDSLYAVYGSECRSIKRLIGVLKVIKEQI